MAPYHAPMVRDEALVLLEKLHRGREQKLGIEINDLQHRCRHSPSNSELKYMWGLEAKVEAQFAFMRRLMRTEGFVMRTMADFDGLDIDGSNVLDPQELQEFVKKRDGFQTKFTLVDARAQQLLTDLDVDGDGKVSRTEWLIYMTYLHWMSFTEETVVEKVVEVTKEYKNDKSGSPVMIESIVQHPGRQLPKPGDATLANQRGAGILAQNLPCLERVRNQITQTQQQSGALGFGKAPPVVAGPFNPSVLHALPPSVVQHSTSKTFQRALQKAVQTCALEGGPGWEALLKQGARSKGIAFFRKWFRE